MASASASSSAAGGVDLQILRAIAGADIEDTIEWATAHGVDPADVEREAMSLESEGYITRKLNQTLFWQLTTEGEAGLTEGSPEFVVLKALPEEEGAAQAEVKAKVGAFVMKAGLGDAKKLGWLAIEKGTGKIVRQVDPAAVDDVTGGHLRAIAAGEDVDAKAIKDLKRRKLIAQAKRTAWALGKGESFATERREMVADLTAAMVMDGSWKEKAFKPFNFDAEGGEPACGVEHTLLKVRSEFRRVLFEMGFEEMPTARYVESCFWNFDALFQPQSHPARDAHDTFFVSKPAKARSVPEAYCERVKAVHQDGGYGSRGYGTVWERDEADKLILRTHTTAVSSRMLYALANQKGGFTPKKYYSIDRVFRNETLDATHLAEFHQVEGIVADYGLGLADLIGTIRDFFHRIGITNLRFKPAYNPYTEPSMEVFGYHPDLKCWTEIGNSGIFRPEMLKPMGLPDGVRVIAWGLSLERPTMIKYRYSNIRDLFGHKVNVTTSKATPIVRF